MVSQEPQIMRLHLLFCPKQQSRLSFGLRQGQLYNWSCQNSFHLKQTRIFHILSNSQTIPVMTSQSNTFWSWKTLTIGTPFLRISRKSSDPGISILDSSKNFKKSGFLGSGANLWKSLDCFKPIILFFECAPSDLRVCSECLGSLEVEESGLFHAQMLFRRHSLACWDYHLIYSKHLPTAFLSLKML